MKFDERFIKERTGHLEKISNMDYEFVFLLLFELVNCKHRSRIYARVYFFFADDPGKL